MDRGYRPSAPILQRTAFCLSAILNMQVTSSSFSIEAPSPTMTAMKNSMELTLAEHAGQVVALTISAWKVAAPSPQEVARRAPHGYVPIRALRRDRLQASLRQPLFAHSW